VTCARVNTRRRQRRNSQRWRRRGRRGWRRLNRLRRRFVIREDIAVSFGSCRNDIVVNDWLERRDIFGDRFVRWLRRCYTGWRWRRSGYWPISRLLGTAAKEHITKHNNRGHAQRSRCDHFLFFIRIV